MTDLPADICPVDQSDLLEDYDADENGVFTFFRCRANDHTYRSRWDGLGWAPDFSEVEA